MVAIDGQFITFEPAQKESPSHGNGRDLLTIDTSVFDGFRHGYAGTIYKGQGRTVDHAYIYHTNHWGRANSYVALSRHKESAHMFVAGEYRDTGKLAKSMQRDDGKVTSLALELADKQTDDPKLGRGYEVNARSSRVEARIAKANHIKRVNTERDNAANLGAADTNAKGLNNTYEDALADMKNYHRGDRGGQSRDYAFADYRASVAATEIGKNPAAIDIAKQRGLARQIAQQAISARSTMRSLASSSSFLIKAAKVLGRGMGM